MNECPKCDGLLVSERDLCAGESIKCLNCGWMKGVDAMPRFTTEAGKQRWLAAMAARRGSTNPRKAGRSSDRTSPSPRSSSPSGGIAGALEEIESKIAALEQVKRALLQAQELVHR